MPPEDTAASTTTPAATPKPAETAQTATVTEKTADVPKDLPFMADRLERERRSTLRKIGLKVGKDEDIDSAIKDFSEKAKSRKERLQVERMKREDAEAKVAKLDGQVAAMKTFAEVELGLLDEESKALVVRLAGNDPAEQLKQIAAVKAIGAKNAKVDAAKTTETAKDAPKIVAAPAHTAPAAAPAPAGTANELPVKERYAQIRALTDPTQREAAKIAFLFEHGNEILSNL